MQSRFGQTSPEDSLQTEIDIGTSDGSIDGMPQIGIGGVACDYRITTSISDSYQNSGPIQRKTLSPYTHDTL